MATLKKLVVYGWFIVYLDLLKHIMLSFLFNAWMANHLFLLDFSMPIYP